MATPSRKMSQFLVVVMVSVIVAVMSVLAVDASRLPSQSGRRGLRGRFNSSPFTHIPSRLSRPRRPQPPVRVTDSARTRLTNNMGEKLKQLLILKYLEERSTAASERGSPATPPPPATVRHDKQIGPFRVSIIEKIDSRKVNDHGNPAQDRNSSRASAFDPGCTQGPRGVRRPNDTANDVPNTIRTNRRAFNAEQGKIACGGPNEAGSHETCYRFNLSSELINRTISGAIVLLPAGNGFSASQPSWNVDDPSMHHNISIVAKFPTSGDDAFRESVSAQNITCDMPSYWRSAPLQDGALLIGRALQDGSSLVLQISVITESGGGQPTLSNYIPDETNMRPVLVVDIVNNGNETSTPLSSASPTGRGDAEPQSDTDHENIVRRLRNRRRTSLKSRLRSRPSRLTSQTIAEGHSNIPGIKLGNVTCTGYPGCCKRPVTFDFDALDFNWIIAPKVITTHVCFSSDAMMTSQNIIDRAFVRTRHSCPPASTKDLRILMIDEHLDIVLLTMTVVDECWTSDVTMHTSIEHRLFRDMFVE